MIRKPFILFLNKRTIWHYKNANTDLMKKVIDNFDCNKASERCDANKQINVLSDTVFNILNTILIDETVKLY